MSSSSSDNGSSTGSGDPPENNSHSPGISDGPDWRKLVADIKAGDQSAIEQFYTMVNRGMRHYLCRQLGPQDLEDKLHDTFLIVVNAIQREDIREPERLMGYTKTIVRRQVAAYIEAAVKARGELTHLESGIVVADKKQNPEQAAMKKQEEELVQKALGKLSAKDREIIVRYRIQEQPKEQVIREMGLQEDGMSKEQANTRFRLLASRAEAKFGEIAKRELAGVSILGGYTVKKPRTDRNAGDGKVDGDGRVDAQELLVMEILSALPLTRIPELAHSDAVSKHTEARKQLIRAVLKERGIAYEGAAIGLEKAKKDLEDIYSRKLYKQRADVPMYTDLHSVQSFLDKRLGKDAAEGFGEKVEKSRAASEGQERW